MMRLAVLSMMLACVSAAGIGDRLMRTYLNYVNFPITVDEAMGGGWQPMGGSCDARYGFPFVNATTGLDRHNPTVLYFNKDGAVSGITVDLHGAPPPQQLIDMRFFEKVGDVYRVGLAFRANPCENSNATFPVGDRVVVAPGGASVDLPLTKQAAEDGKWAVGSCFSGMGTHYFYDVLTAPVMSWKAENLLPVITMYNNDGDLQAIFFASWTIQAQVGDSNDWERMPLTTGLFCRNMCDPACTFAGTSWWSTYHLYFRDLSLATCPNDCQIACCDK